MDAVIITPTIGTDQLKDAVKSVLNQTCSDLMHFIVVDGESHLRDVDKILNQFNSTKISKMVVPCNTGNGIDGFKFNGHRIYAACSYLVNAKYVFFLDEDNWFDTNHVLSLIQLIEDEKLDWAYSLRKICTADGHFVTNDDCENLGPWPSFSGNLNLVDTNCYAVKRQVLTSVCDAWFHPLGADRVFFKKLSVKFPNFKTTSRYSVNYRLHLNRPPNADFFLAGNAHMLQRYGNKLPWKSGDN